jgi:diaminopropionate ammonia-lyase
MRVLVNEAVRPERVPAPSDEARAFHAALPGYAPTPLHDLGDGVLLKDESARLGLPAFKVLGASWAIERALRERPGVEVLVAASAGNHGRAVAHEARRRGLRCRVFLPTRSVAARREAIADEGAEVVVVDGGYEDAVAEAARAGAEPGALEIADVGASGPARWVVDGYATLFAEAAEQAPAPFELVLVPVGVGSLAAAAARFGASTGAKVVGAEPATAACLTASLRAGAPAVIPTPGTSMAGLDCAEVSEAAWPELRDGIHGTVVVTDEEAHAAMRELASRGLAIGDSGAAPFAALRALRDDPHAAALRDVVSIGRVLLVATEGPTDPVAYAQIVG